MNPTKLFPSLWHRRAASVIAVGSAVSLALLGYTFFSAGNSADVVLLEALCTGVAAVLMSFIARMPVPDKIASWFSFLGFAFSVGATGLGLMSSTGSNIHLILVVVLSLFSLTAGLFGPIGWLVLVAVITPYFVAHFSSTTAPRLTDSLTFVAFYALPIIASWLLWHGGAKRAAASGGDRTYSTLAEQLSQVSNESEIVISTIADGVVALNNKGEIQLINPAAQKTLGWSQKDSMGLDYRSIIKLQDKQGNVVSDLLNPIAVSLRNVKSVERSDLVMVTSSGRTFQARISVTPIGSAGDGVIVVFRDVTAEKEEEREQAEFVSTASHEMRTPVATIEGYLGLALNPNTAAIDEKARAYLQKAHESAQHLGRLFQDLLDVTKADDGRLRNLPSVTDLVAFCSDIVAGMNAKAAEKGLSLTFAPLSDDEATERRLTPMYYADVDNDHLREIMNNLVDNAIKYTKSGSVTVNVSGDTDSCTITVHDSGIGIPREDIPHLFQKFYRVDNSDTREIGGTGLGLYLCRKLVEFIGGKIWVESEYGHGTTFSLSLPRLDYETAQSRMKAIAEQRERQAANAVDKEGSSEPVPPAPEHIVLPLASPTPSTPTTNVSASPSNPAVPAAAPDPIYSAPAQPAAAAEPAAPQQPTPAPAAPVQTVPVQAAPAQAAPAAQPAAAPASAAPAAPVAAKS